MIFKKNKLKDSLEAGAGVRGRAAAFGKSRKRVDGGAFMTESGAVLEFRSGKRGECRSYMPSRSVEWEHPWKTTLTYYEKSSGLLKNFKGEVIEGWGARVKPGFVAGLDPIVTAAPDIDVGEDRGAPPRAGGRGVNAVSRREALKEKPGLADRPIIPLAVTPVIKKTAQIPQQLRDLGAVGEDPDISVTGSAVRGNISATTQGVIGQEAGGRLVASTGLHIAVARPSFTLDVDYGGFPLSGPIQYNINYGGQSLNVFGPRPRLNTGLPEKRPEPSFQDRLNGAYEDDGMDYFVICEIFFLSPEAAGIPRGRLGGAIVDHSWQPFVRHCCFWNLEYRLKLETPKNVPQLDVTTWALPILGRYTMAPIATANAAESEFNRIMAAALQRNSPKGIFWTV
jgi:hypothetical protein